MGPDLDKKLVQEKAERAVEIIVPRTLAGPVQVIDIARRFGESKKDFTAEG